MMVVIGGDELRGAGDTAGLIGLSPSAILAAEPHCSKNVLHVLTLIELKSKKENFSYDIGILCSQVRQA